jgi:hypothetical protein
MKPKGKGASRLKPDYCNNAGLANDFLCQPRAGADRDAAR